MTFIFRYLVTCLLLLFSFRQLEGCTAFQLQSKDGAFIYCRSMEYGFPLDSNLLIVPRGTLFQGTAPQGKPGIKWKVKYGFVGMNQCLEPKIVADGMNEKGLVVGSLYLPGFAKYEALNKKKLKRTLGYWEIPNFLLSNCATVEEVKSILATVIVPEQPLPEIKNFIMPLHFYIGDRSGKVLIVEYVGGKRYEYDNPLGTLTNSPPFSWHLSHLGNFVNLSPVNVVELPLTNWKINFFGQGSGLLGLPGDYSSPSRFARAALFSQWASKQETAEKAVLLGFHILNTFDIFEGIIRARSDGDHTGLPIKKLPNGSSISNQLDMTEWVVVHDLLHLKTYFRTYKGLQIQMVDLKKIDFAQPGVRQIEINKSFRIEDVTDKASSLPPKI